MPAMKHVLAAVGVMAGMALLACAGNGDSAGPSATPPSATAAPTSTTSPPASDAEAQLRALASGLSTKEAHVVYSYTATPAGGAAQEGTLTAFRKKPDWRFDYVSGATSGTLLSLARTTYHCTPDDGGQCAQSPSLSDVPLPFISLLTDPQSLAGAVGAGVTRSTRAVVDQQADCFAGAGAVQACFGSDGILLGLTGRDTAGNQFTIEASSVGGPVTDDDLLPPYPPCNCGLP